MPDIECADCGPTLYHYRCKVCRQHFSGDVASVVGDAMWEHPCHQVVREAWFVVHAPELAH